MWLLGRERCLHAQGRLAGRTTEVVCLLLLLLLHARAPGRVLGVHRVARVVDGRGRARAILVQRTDAEVGHVAIDHHHARLALRPLPRVHHRRLPF